jgi:hypothetical protein
MKFKSAMIGRSCWCWSPCGVLKDITSPYYVLRFPLVGNNSLHLDPRFRSTKTNFAAMHGSAVCPRVDPRAPHGRINVVAGVPAALPKSNPNYLMSCGRFLPSNMSRHLYPYRDIETGNKNST